MRASDLIWNRAATENGGNAPSRGDIALSALLSAHGLAMNGGVLHAAELLTEDNLKAALDGYRFFGLDAVAELLVRARHLVGGGGELDVIEHQLDAEYEQYVPCDSELYGRFERHLRMCPADFSPV